MHGLWLVSYVVLWFFVLLQTALLVALLRHIGNLRLWLQDAGILQKTNINEEGLPIGEFIPDIRDILMTEVEPKIDINRNLPLLLIFVAPGLFGADKLITAIKQMEDQLAKYQVVFISMEPSVDEHFDFIRKTGIKSPVVLQHGWQIAAKCRVRSAPYAVTFDPIGVLQSKGGVSDQFSIQHLLEKHNTPK
ncbi:MAG: hypothetical protein Fur0022_28540 [Anaerolineales bacterium]